MPYKTIADLPQSLRAHLPEHAQEIYVGAFNNAWQYYGTSSHRRSGSSREETAHRVAWAAVKASYIKAADGRWKRRE